MTNKDQEAIAKLYLEQYMGNRIYSDERETTLDDNLYREISDIIYSMSGSTLQEVVDAISTQLDIRVQNLSNDTQKIIIDLYNRVNN